MNQPESNDETKNARDYANGTKPVDEQLTDEQKRTDQLTSAPQAVPSDADPRIDVEVAEDGTRRITIRDDAAVRPGHADDSE